MTDAPSHFSHDIVRRSARANAHGIAKQTRLVAPWSHTVREILAPPGVLHVKTDCALLDAKTVFVTHRLAASGCFDDYFVVHRAPCEDAAANAIRFNDVVLQTAGYPRTRDAVERAGYTVVEIGNSECARLDGDLSCRSLRFTPGP